MYNIEFDVLNIVPSSHPNSSWGLHKYENCVYMQQWNLKLKIIIKINSLYKISRYSTYYHIIKA
jgi:hypothetical protein